MKNFVDAEIKMHKGRPSVFIDGQPTALPAYSPITWREGFLQRSGPNFFSHCMGAYMLGLPQTKNPPKWGESPFWEGDVITESPTAQFALDLDAQAEFILKGDPGAYLLIRNAPEMVPSWLDLHPDHVFASEDGKKLEIPSLASDLIWECRVKAVQASVRYCEKRPWAHRIIGYWYGMCHEGTHFPLFEGLLFDHCPVMLARWRKWLRDRYGSDKALQAAWGKPTVHLDDVQVPRDNLRGRMTDVSDSLYWQAGADNAPLRDYLLLQKELFHAGVKGIFDAQKKAVDRKRIFVTDAFKQKMQGWSNFGFFDSKFNWQLSFPETMAGSGSIEAAELLDHPGCDGLITPIDYQVRGAGGITEPEGANDSAVLRGKYFFAECDIRTWVGDAEKTSYGTARNIREFSAVSWRGVADGLARGYNPYWMDLVGDWFNDARIHEVIRRSVEVMKESVNWERAEVPCLAMVVDDAAALETNGSGNFPNEAIMWELKYGMSRCGVPYRIYLLEDLALENFPAHKLFYFPNLFKVTEQKLELLKKKIFRNGNLVVWGPGSGISDGQRIGTESASKLTGFSFDILNVNHPRRTHIQNFDHPITEGFAEDVIFGSPLAYGPVLYPTDGISLGLSWTKMGKTYSGLSVKTFGRGPSGAGNGDWTSVFTTSVPMPANLWRNLARYSGTHVYCESNDVLIAGGSIVALHSIRSGRKKIRLPGKYDVIDLLTGKIHMQKTDTIEFGLEAPETRIFRIV